MKLIRLSALYLAVLSVLLATNLCAYATTVTWGVGGAGGSGNWDAFTKDWWNGTTNISWPVSPSIDAIFQGSSGSIFVTSNQALSGAQSLTFNTPGYSLSFSGESASRLTVVTDGDTFFNGSLNVSSLTKSGTASLFDYATGSLQTLTVQQGLLVSGNGSLSTVSLSDTAGATLMIDSGFASILNLSGGGYNGGLIQPRKQPMSLFVELGTYGGVLADNGTNQLTLNAGYQVQLTNANTYTGATYLQGSLILSGSGSLQSSLVVIPAGCALTLDNTTTSVTNRLSGSTQVNMYAGSFLMTGNSNALVEESAGTLNLVTSEPTITVQQSGTATALCDFAGLTREGSATLSIVGSGVKITGLAADATGILPTYLTTGSDWAALDGNGRITAYSNYSTSFATGSASDNVLVSQSGTTALTSPVTRNSINLQNSSGASQVLDLGPSQNFELTSGGILESGSSLSVIREGSLSTPAAEWDFAINGTLEVDSALMEENPGTNLVKSGPGELILSGSNELSGAAVLNEGTLGISSDTSIGAGGIDLAGGTLQARASFTLSKPVFGSPNIYSNTIDTNGFNLTLSSTASASFTKTGAGTLTMMGPFASVVVSNGTLSTLNDKGYGSVTMNGGALTASGTLSSLAWQFLPTGSVLDIGGTGAASLTINDFVASTTGLTIEFGIGSTQSDSLNVLESDYLLYQGGTLIFDFSAIGPVTTGTSYTLITGPLVTQGTPFSFSPANSAAGWSGTFTEQNNTLSVQFSSVPNPVPEPGFSLVVLLASAVMCVGVGMRRQV